MGIESCTVMQNETVTASDSSWNGSSWAAVVSRRKLPQSNDVIVGSDGNRDDSQLVHTLPDQLTKESKGPTTKVHPTLSPLKLTPEELWSDGEPASMYL